MARPPKLDDATGKLKPGAKTQQAERGTKAGPSSRTSIFADFNKIARSGKVR
jgi:hypothetical protein